MDTPGILSQRYSVFQELDNTCIKNNTDGNIFAAYSLIICALWCQEKCTCFGYNQKNNKCHVYETCLETSDTNSADEWKYFKKRDSSSCISKSGRKIMPDCLQLLLEDRTRPSGNYTICPGGDEARLVYCGMETEGGGWTVILKRHDGSVNFARNWTEYKEGFGDISEYWIGNEMIHQLTTIDHSLLYIVITHLNGSQLYEIYDYFLVSNETDGYRISLGEGSGTLGNSMMPSNPLRGIKGMRFTTTDRDKEYWVHGNCAVSHGGGGGWWYNDCHDAMLTGPYGKAEWNKPWYPVYYTGEQIKAVQMMTKRRNP